MLEKLRKKEILYFKMFSLKMDELYLIKLIFLVYICIFFMNFFLICFKMNKIMLIICYC